MKQENNLFFNLGKELVLTSAKLGDESLNDTLQKKYASILADIIITANNKVTKEAALLKKIANTTELSNTSRDILRDCSEVLIEKNIDKKTFAKFAGIAELGIKGLTLPVALASRMGGLGLPIMGAVGGGLSWLAEKELSEDDIKSELLKAQIQEYRALATALEKQLREKYKYKTVEELQKSENA